MFSSKAIVVSLGTQIFLTHGAASCHQQIWQIIMLVLLAYCSNDVCQTILLCWLLPSYAFFVALIVNGMYHSNCCYHYLFFLVFLFWLLLLFLRLPCPNRTASVGLWLLIAGLMDK